jgi:hypothetical protein
MHAYTKLFEHMLLMYRYAVVYCVSLLSLLLLLLLLLLLPLLLLLLTTALCCWIC